MLKDLRKQWSKRREEFWHFYLFLFYSITAYEHLSKMNTCFFCMFEHALPSIMQDTQEYWTRKRKDKMWVHVLDLLCFLGQSMWAHSISSFSLLGYRHFELDHLFWSFLQWFCNSKSNTFPYSERSKPMWKDRCQGQYSFLSWNSLWFTSMWLRAMSARCLGLTLAQSLKADPSTQSGRQSKGML